MILFQTLRRHIATLGTGAALGTALLVGTGATPAYAFPQLDVTKTHVGTFTRGGQGVYRVTVTNTGDQPTGFRGPNRSR